jgi:hypothetical protein
VKPRETSRSYGILALLVLSVCLRAAPPASAHAGNKVQLYVSEFVVRPSNGATAWTIVVSLVDADSGAAASGFDVAAFGTESRGAHFGPVPLVDAAGTGEYTGEVTAEPGSWSISIRAKEHPGGEPAVPLARAWTVALHPGSPAEAAPEQGHVAGGHAEESGSSWASRLLLGAAVLSLGGMAVAARRRRRLQVAP